MHTNRDENLGSVPSGASDGVLGKGKSERKTCKGQAWSEMWWHDLKRRSIQRRKAEWKKTGDVRDGILSRGTGS